MVTLCSLPALRVAVLTPVGRGAVASLRVQGPLAALDEVVGSCFRAVNGRRLAEQLPGRIVFGHWGTSPAEEVVLSRQGGDAVEVHCHGGQAATARLLADLRRGGCAVVSWVELSADREDCLTAECQQVFSQAPTAKLAGLLWEQVDRLWPQFIGELRQASSERALSLLENSLRWSEWGRHLTSPWRVVLAGRPNVGKSSLINALVGYRRAVVFDEPGTTRDVVTAETAFDGWLVQLADTAGLREVSPPEQGGAAAELEAQGIARGRHSFAAADCRVIVLDRSQPVDAADWSLLAEWPEALVVAHKADLPKRWGAAERGGDVLARGLEVSSLRGTGLDALMQAIVGRLVPDLPPADVAVPLTARQADLLQQGVQALRSHQRVRYEEVLSRLQHGSGPSAASPALANESLFSAE